MGWFWADSSSSLPKAAALHQRPDSNSRPPPACPMHAATGAPSLPRQDFASKSPASCPVEYPSGTGPSSTTTNPTLSRLNPLNYMPSDLSQARAPRQTVHLPVERETSSIPRGDAESNWEYPSPQQMYNALLRKGYDHTPEDAVETMVAVHNFLNEGAWAEIVDWEARFARGLGHGWRTCRRGEQGAAAAMAETARDPDAPAPPRLLRFQGRPDKMTPKAKMLQMLGSVSPYFRGEPPFDRHDWFVQRLSATGVREVRYVIDYYAAPPEPTGEPVFYLDVRPAVDGPTAAVERLMRWGGDVWYRASGAPARE